MRIYQKLLPELDYLQNTVVLELGLDFVVGLLNRE